MHGEVRLLCRGFARLKCDSCSEQHLVAFACKRRGICPSCLGRELAQSGAVVAVQRASSDLKLNPHLHAVLDGVSVPGPDGTPEFRTLPRLSTRMWPTPFESLAPASCVTSKEGA